MKVKELYEKAVGEIYNEKVEFAKNKMKSLIKKREALQRAIDDLDREIIEFKEKDVENVEFGFRY